MFKNLLEDLLNYIKTRTFVLGVICVVMIGILVHRLFDLQIINGEDYLNTFTYLYSERYRNRESQRNHL